jgi:RNA polymerase sigma-70 factor (ECF subfamily)
MQPRQQQSEQTRKTVLLRLRADGPERNVAWREFYDIYAPIIKGFAYNLGLRGADIDEVTSDVITSFFSASEQFEYNPEKGRFRGYLKTCTAHAMARKARATRRMSGVDLSNLDPMDKRVDEAWNDAWERERVQTAIAAVRKRYAVRRDMAQTFQMYEMYVLFGNPAEVVAKELGVTVAQVYVSKTRITDAIRDELVRSSDLFDDEASVGSSSSNERGKLNP